MSISSADAWPNGRHVFHGQAASVVGGEVSPGELAGAAILPTAPRRYAGSRVALPVRGERFTPWGNRWPSATTARPAGAA